MANWEATTQSTVIDTSAASSAVISARESTRSASSVGGGSFNIFSSIFSGGGGFSIVGINANEVPKMREQIRNSVNAIQQHLDGIEAQTSSSNAFRSDDIKQAVENYVTAVKDYCKALTSDLLVFSDKLQEVRLAWEQSTQNFANDSIHTTNESLAGAATYYTETMQ